MTLACSQCGAELRESLAFCAQCGAPHKNEAASKVAIFAVIVVVVWAAIGGGFIYSYRGRQKATARKYEHNLNKSVSVSDLTAAASQNAVTPPEAIPSSAPAVTTEPSPEAPSTLAVTVPVVPVAASGDPIKDWALPYERTANSPEADLVVRTGYIDNFGFGWPKGFDPFSGQSTPPHRFPWIPPAGTPEGTGRLLIGSAVTPNDQQMKSSDGYSSVLNGYECMSGRNAPDCKAGRDSLPQPITIAVGTLPAKIDAVLVQMFLDDFQAPTFHSHFQVSIDGTRIPTFEDAVNSLIQTGPVGKLVSLRLLPEYWPLLQSGNVNILIDDPATHASDGYAIDFVRVLVNPHEFKYQVSLAATVVDADKHTPISGATVTAALESAVTDSAGKCALNGLPAGLVVASASAPGYDENSVPVDLVAGQTGTALIELHRHEENTAALERAIAQTGSATIYGIHFDTRSAKLRPDSSPALAAILGLIKNHPGSHWIIAGHADNQGGADSNQRLSEARAASVVNWLSAHEVAAEQLVPQGFGPNRPVADNTSANGRALNRRVEIASVPKS